MTSDYNQHFKKAKQSKQKEAANENNLREKLQMRARATKKNKTRPPVMPLIVLVGCLVGAIYGYNNIGLIEQYVDLVEFEIFGAAKAQDSKPSEAESAQTAGESKAKDTLDQTKAKKSDCVEMKGFTEEELSHFNKLNERKIELDMRDAELTALEEELHKQRVEVEGRIVQLEKIREEVGSVLKERVEVDQQKVSTLVDFYSNMKPKQAADVFTNLNEDLAVEVLGRMKKKSAADILNLLEPAKARALSEKFTGYKRR